MKISQTFFINLFLIIIIKLVLEYSYILFVVPTFSYAGFVYDLFPGKYMFGWLIYIFGYILLVARKKKIYIYEIYLLLFLFYILPNIIYYSLSNQETKYFLAIIVPFFIVVYSTSNRKFFKYKSLHAGKIKILLISLASVLLVLFHYFISTGGKIVLDFSQVYVFREEYGIISAEGIFGYLNNWAMKIFAVLLFSWAISKKKMSLVIVTFSFIILLFMFSSHKSALAGIFMVVFFYIISKAKDTSLLILFIFLSFVGIILLIVLSSDSVMLGSMMIRRLFFVPARLNFTYFDFFSHNEFIYWSNSIFKYFIDYPYKLSATNVIGNYLGNSNMAANTGFSGSGFMHAGYFGVAIYTGFAIILMNLINQLALKTNKFIVFSVVFFPVNTYFVSSDLFTALLTHGLGVAIIVLWLYQDKDYKLKIGKHIYQV